MRKILSVFLGKVFIMPIHDWTRVTAGIFHDFHHEWISAIKRALNSGLLPPNYYALAEQVAGGLGPDVLTLDNLSSDDQGNGSTNALLHDAGGAALATAPPKVRFTAETEMDRFWGQHKIRPQFRYDSAVSWPESWLLVGG